MAAVLRTLRGSTYPVDEILLYPREYFTARFIPGEAQPDLAAFHLRFERICRGLFERGCNFALFPAAAVDGLAPARLWIDESSKEDYADLLERTAHTVVCYADATLDGLLKSTLPKGPVSKNPGQDVTMSRWHDAHAQRPLWFVANGTSRPQGIRIAEPCEVEDVFGARSTVEAAGSLELAPLQSVIIRPAAVGTVAHVRSAEETTKVDGADISMKAIRAVQRLGEWRIRTENNGRRRRITLSSSFMGRAGCRVWWAREDVRAGSARATVWVNDRSVSLNEGISLFGDPEISFFDVSSIAREGENSVRVELNEDPWVNRESGSICDSWVIHEGSDPVGEPLVSNVSLTWEPRLGKSETFRLHVDDGGSMFYRIPLLDKLIPIGPLGITLGRRELSTLGGHLELVAYHPIRRLFEPEPDREILDRIRSITLTSLD